MKKDCYVYILGNQRPTLYIGSTSNLAARIKQHKNGTKNHFTKKYSVFKLLYFELYNDNRMALKREKQLKHWKREWKLNLIKKTNPYLKDLSF